ncbi:MAG: DUF2812 domain-containing protein [Lachnospiraceae bacterium]|nr:DUF2812 domain-containing protein [Lachnospiraceae bacterium]
MIKFKLYFDKDAETAWLNEMCAQGWAMQSFFAGLYFFEKCEPGKYLYQVDFREKFFRVTEEYRELMNDMGVTIIQNWGYWVILRKDAKDGAFELYTDAESQIEHYTKIRNMLKAVTILELICFFIEVMAACAGNAFALPFSGVILAIVIAMLNATVKTNEAIDRLKEQQSGIPAAKKRNISMLMAIGLLMNSCALIMQDSISGYIKLTVQIIAIVFMLVGLWQTCRKKA